LNGITERWTAHLKNLVKCVEHAKSVIQAQQCYGQVAGLKEKVRLSQIVDEALKLNDASFVRHNIKLTKQYDEDCELVTEKHKVLQILVNLINNAKDSLYEADREDRQLRLRIYRRRLFAGIEVADNGVGIPPENLKRIFDPGFTTKQGGHGFGLHFCALTAAELGGKLIAKSDGPGKGASFTLWLPVKVTEQRKGGSRRGSRKGHCIQAETVCQHAGVN